ncbi:MAG: Holliday junction resolvase RuvX [Verrucomicrobia bacterium]|nr:Holliday junction resolvase RuvX [Verrucomicrobiota bacterium]
MRGRVLGVDYGERRIGLAVSDPLGITAQPAGTVTISTPREAMRAVGDAATRHGAVHVVVGLPRSMSGAIGPKAREVIRFVAAFQCTASVAVSLWDERLTSVSAGRVFDQGGVSERDRRGKVDTMAAQLMLQSYLDALRRTSAGGRGA